MNPQNHTLKYLRTYFDKCLLCGKSMTGFLFYHKDCFKERPRRYISRNIGPTIHEFISRFQKDKPHKPTFDIKARYSNQLSEQAIIFFKSYSVDKKYNGNELPLIGFSDVDLLVNYKFINWLAVSAQFTFKHLDHFWKFAPYINFEHFFRYQRNHSNLEQIVLDYEPFFNINWLEPKFMTKLLLMKFHEEIDWRKFSKSNATDQEILRRFFNKYEFDWVTIFNRLNFSDYLLEKYLKAINWTYIALFEKTNHKVPLKIVSREFASFLGSSQYKLFETYQIDNALLDEHAALLKWEAIVKNPIKLEGWFIQKHWKHFAETIPEKLETVGDFIQKQSLYPAIVFESNSHKVELYDPQNPPVANPRKTYYFPDDDSFLKGHIVYAIARPIDKRSKLGLKFYKKKQKHYLTNPWKVYPNTKRLVARQERLTLRRTLRKNGLGRKENRSKQFNTFLKTNHLI